MMHVTRTSGQAHIDLIVFVHKLWESLERWPKRAQHRSPTKCINSRCDIWTLIFGTYLISRWEIDINIITQYITRRLFHHRLYWYNYTLITQVENRRPDCLKKLGDFSISSLAFLLIVDLLQYLCSQFHSSIHLGGSFGKCPPRSCCSSFLSLHCVHLWLNEALLWKYTIWVQPASHILLYRYLVHTKLYICSKILIRETCLRGCVKKDIQ